MSSKARIARASILALPCLLALSACNALVEKKTVVEQHAMHGVVQSLDPATKTATIKHEAIKDFMGAMTMEYPVRDAAAFARLHVGETIDGTVFVQDGDYWVGKITEAK